MTSQGYVKGEEKMDNRGEPSPGAGGFDALVKVLRDRGFLNLRGGGGAPSLQKLQAAD